SGYGFDDEAGDVLAVLVEDGFGGVEVVVGHGEGAGGLGLGDAGAGGYAEGGEAAAGFDEQAVDVAVVTAFDFDDEVASGDAAREADGTHGGFGAAVDEADFFNRRHELRDLFGEFELRFGGHAETCAAFHGLADAFDDGGVRV